MSKSIKALIIITTLLAFTSSVWLYSERNQIVFTCVGQYSASIDYPGISISNSSNIVVSVSNSNRIFVNMNSAIIQNGHHYHLSRQVWYSYEPVDLKYGMLRITPIRVSVNSTDNVPGNNVNHYLLGVEKAGLIIRVWKLSDNTLLIGNSFTPVFSCRIVD